VELATAASAKTTSAATGASRAPAGLLQRKCACGGTPGPSGACEGCRRKRLGLQPMLRVGLRDDACEREADQVADRLVRAGNGSAGAFARSPGARLVQRSAGNAELAAAPDIVHQVLETSGRPLDSSTRSSMEEHFGHDFGRVRVHTDARAMHSAMAVDARAYTMGPHIVFAEGEYAPATASGRWLLAHELTHVVQQGGEMRMESSGAGTVGTRETERGSTAVAAPDPFEPVARTTSGGRLQRAAPLLAAPAAACVIGALIGLGLDLAIQSVGHMVREKTWRFWEMAVDTCSTVISAVLGCFGGIASKLWLDPLLATHLGPRLGGFGLPLVGKVLLWVAQKTAMGVPKAVLAKLVKLGCVTPEQAAAIAANTASTPELEKPDPSIHRQDNLRPRYPVVIPLSGSTR